MLDFDVYARFYELDYGAFDSDLVLFQQFAARTGSPVLDMACGTGRVLLPLARQGYQVTGVDNSEAMLAIAREKVTAEGLHDRVVLHHQDMRQLDLGRRFNLVLVALNSFTHLASLDDQLSTLARMYQHLQPGGVLVLDLFNPDLDRLLGFQGQVTLDKTMLDEETGHQVMRFRTEKVDFGRQILHMTYIVDEVDSQGTVKRTLFPFHMRYIFRYELELLLRYTGFALEAIYGSYDLDPFEGDSGKMIAVARRPD
ncbi:MAG: class I SAM-dependent methyltransferase [Anaerolineae bacterium]|jgi:SAM-dependent methyltransferase